jgi:hypothetical protein
MSIQKNRPQSSIDIFIFMFFAHPGNFFNFLVAAFVFFLSCSIIPDPRSIYFSNFIISLFIQGIKLPSYRILVCVCAGAYGWTTVSRDSTCVYKEDVVQRE